MHYSNEHYNGPLKYIGQYTVPIEKADFCWRKQVLLSFIILPYESIAPSVPLNVDPEVVDQKSIVVKWERPSENWNQVSKYQVKLEFRSRDKPTESGRVLLNFTHDRIHGRQYKITTLRPYADYKLSIREGTGDKPVWGNFSEPVTFQMPEGSK